MTVAISEHLACLLSWGMAGAGQGTLAASYASFELPLGAKGPGSRYFLQPKCM